PFRNQISHFVGREKVYLPLRPDGIFAFSKHQGSATLCLLETDRATMPVNAPRPLKKQSFIRSSIYKKLVAYWRALETEQFKNHYGVNAILILFVTTSQARIQEMQAVLSDAKGAAGAKKSEGHFLFGCQNAMCAETIFSYLWLRGDGQYKALL
ncbi:MAG: hypothetical protein KC422_25595, partial [Trueperaceae bacterium]|nr:hypothetical protein [Trueperaceae bacterium]